MKNRLLLLSFVFLFVNNTFASGRIDWPSIWQQRPYYFAVALGWGTTDWSQLVARCQNADDCITLSLSAPVSAGDNGFVYGATLGAEISPHFALETNYMRFPNTSVRFGNYSYYFYEYNVTSINSNTYAYNVVGKFMVQIAHTGLRGYANAGPSVVHRQDTLIDAGHICPTFGVGLDYVIAKRIMTELAFQYYAGYGKATLRPVLNYMPFLYTFHIKIGYRF